MKKLRTGFAAACIAVSLLATGCRTDQSLTSFLGYEEDTYVASNKPRFINELSLTPSGSNKGIQMNTVIDRSVVVNNNMVNDEPAPQVSRPTKDRDMVAKAQTGAMGTIVSKYASILGVLPNMLSNSSLYKFIDDWYGVRYRYGGTDKSGIDCSAFVQRLYETVFSTSLLRTAFDQFQNVSLMRNADNLREGDLVFFHVHSRKRITHVGIYLANNFFVHASLSQGVMISSLTEGYWQRFFAGAGRINN